MKKILSFLFDVILIAIAWAISDAIVLKLQIENIVAELVIFIGISLVLEVLKYIISRPFKR